MPFQVETFNRAPYVQNIGELMRAGGQDAARGILNAAQARAQAQQQNGQNWAQTIGTVGQVVAGIPGQIEKQKVAGQDAKLRDLQIGQAQQTVDDRTSLDTAFSAGTSREDILSRLPGHMRPAVQKQFSDADDAALKVRKLKDEAAVAERDYLGSLGAAVKAHNYDPNAAMLALQHAKEQGYNVDGLVKQIQQDPSHLPQMVDSLIASSPKQVELQNTASRNAEQATHNRALEGQSAATLAAQAADRDADNARAAGTAAETARHNRVTENHAASQTADSTSLTSAGLDMAALSYRKTGVMPTLGMGDKGNRQKIMNRAAELTPADITRIEAGGTDVAGNKADYKADSGSLAKLVGQRDAIGSFEQTALKNIDLFLDVAKKVPDTGIPLLNTPARWIAGAGGSADMAKYAAARQVAVSEIAKITQNPNLVGQLSDSARQEIESFNPQNATLAQSIAVMGLLKQDMGNRKTSLDDQIKSTRERIGGGGATTGVAKDGDERPIPGYPGQTAVYRGGRWVVK